MKGANSLREFRQDTEFEMLGQFVYAGGSLDDGVTGKIVYKKDRLSNKLELEIYGELYDPDLDFNLEGFNKSYKIIGFTNNGFTVIIDKAVKISANESYPGIPYTKYGVSMCLFLNINYYKSFDVVSNKLSSIGIDNLEVKGCQFSFTGIDEWIGETKVKYEKIDSKYKYEVNIDNINENIYFVKDENLKFASGIEIKIGSGGFNEEFYWGLESIDGQDLSIKSTMNNLKMVKELLEILITVPIDFSYLKFKVPIEEMENKLVTGYLVSSGINTGKYRRINTDIPYAKIKENFENILCNWYEKRHKLTLISQNFIINKYARQYNQSVLLNSIKSLEMYHRNFIQEREEERLKPYIKKNSEINFKNRLIDLFDNLNDEIKDKLIKKNDNSSEISIEEFATKLVETRNYYTHGDPKKLKESVIIDPIEIIETTLLLNQLIKYFVCSELFEVDDEIIGIITMGMNGVIK